MIVALRKIRRALRSPSTKRREAARVAAWVEAAREAQDAFAQGRSTPSRLSRWQAQR